MERLTHTMRILRLAPALVLLPLLGAGCSGSPKGDSKDSDALEVEAARPSPELEPDEASRLVRSTERNVMQYQEMLLQGQTSQMVALRRTIARTVDENFETFARMARESEFLLHRNSAVKCLGFALEKREEAVRVLTELCDDQPLTIMQNAALGLGLLRDPEFDITPLVKLLAHGDLTLRTNAATALRDIFLVKPTPRDLTPQYWAAIDRLVSLLHEKGSVRARRAAAWALANLRHPDVLDHLVTSLADSDESVQIAGLRGIELLGDQRALEPVLEYLDGGPTSNGASWARKALVSIALQGGFAKTSSELDELGTSAREWRRWFRAARMR